MVLEDQRHSEVRAATSKLEKALTKAGINPEGCGSIISVFHNRIGSPTFGTRGQTVDGEIHRMVKVALQANDLKARRG